MKRAAVTGQTEAVSSDLEEGHGLKLDFGCSVENQTLSEQRSTFQLVGTSS